VERTEQPSTSAEITATRFAVLNLFMVNPSYQTALACQAESDGFTINNQAFVRFLDQRAFAALRATILRCLLVIVSSRRLPPMRPPFRPISAMT
jgi:hypothetical protein